MCEMLLDKLRMVLKTQFLANGPWKKKILSPQAQEMSDEQLCAHAKVGFNFPPSQFQLHLQFMLPPFVPQQYQLIHEGKGFQHGRFFPVEFVMAALTCAAKSESALTTINHETTVQEITDHFEKFGVSYKAAHEKFTKEVLASQQLLGNWQASDFTMRLKDGQLLHAESGQLVEGTSFLDIVKADKNILQNYGRPYDAGMPTGFFYKHAKTDRMPEW